MPSHDMTESIPESYPWFYKPAVGSQVGGNKTSSWVSRVDKKVSVNTPGWPHAYRENAYFRAVYRASGSPWPYSATFNSGASAGGTECIGTMCGTNPLWPVDYTEERVRVQDILIRKMQDKLSAMKVNLATAFVERQQASNLVASTARRIAQSVHSLRKGKFAEAARQLTGSTSRLPAKRALGGIPEQWLALQYGWKPLLSDVHGACEAVAAAHSNERPPVYTVRATHREQLDKIKQEFPRGPDSYLPATIKSRNEGSVSGRGLMEFRVTSQLASDLAHTGITNPALLAWEVLPYSFVVDWFIPVGSYLQRLDYSRGIEFSRGFVVCKVSDSWTVRSKETSFDGPAGSHMSYQGGNLTSTCDTVGRTIVGSAPPPVTPQFKDPFSLLHVSEALSLLATAFGR